MNKKVIGFLLSIPALMGVGLTSCSDESTIAVKETAQDKLVNVTLTASLPDQTRASFDPEKNILKFKWELNDEILVVNAANGKFLGKLTVSKIQDSDPRVCSFAGSCNIPAGKVKLNFYYLGKGGKATYNMDFTVQDYLVDFSTQDGKANFADHDILMSVGEFENVQDGNLGMINFDRDFAYGRFILKYNGQELDLNGKSVTISGPEGKFYNKATLNFQNAVYSYTPGSIVVTPSTNDFYVSLFETEESIRLTFEIQDFDGSVGGHLTANTYYTANTEGEPIVVEMRHTDGSDDKHDYNLHYDPNYTSTEIVSAAVAHQNCVSPANFTVEDYDLFTREDHVITSWNTKADGTGDKYEAGSTFTLEGENYEGTLYAQWEEKTYNYTLIFANVNGVEQTRNEFTGTNNLTVKVLDKETDTATAFRTQQGFNGWALPIANPNAPENMYTVIAESVTFDKAHTTIKVYPRHYVWQVHFIDGVTNGNIGKRITWSYTTSKNMDKTFPTKPTHEGYKWIGWFYGEKEVNDYNKHLPLTLDDMTPRVVATFEENTITTGGYQGGQFNN